MWSPRSVSWCAMPNELQIHDVRLEAPNGPIRAGQVRLDTEAQRATFIFDGPIEPASGYRLRLSLHGHPQ
jgi:hypothetical protein